MATLPTWKGEVEGSNPHLLGGGGWDGETSVGFDSHSKEAGQKSKNELE